MKPVPLAKVAQIIMGQSPPSSTYNTDGEGLPFFQGKADFGDLYPTARMFCTEPKKIAEAGDILISVRAPVGPTNISPEKSCIGRGLAAIRSSQDIDRDYLLYFLRHYESELAQHGRGSTFGAISRNDLESILVPFRPLPEQKRLATLLAKVDRLRRLRRYARELSNTYLQSVFLEMFGDPVSNPMGWEVLPLTSLSEGINYGVTAPASMEPVGPKFLRITDIQQGMVDWKNVPYCEISEKDTRNSVLRNGDIVFARTGATTGKSFLIQDCPKDAVFASYLIRVKAGARIDPFYLFGYFQSPAYWLQISSSASGSAQSGVNATKLGQLKVPVPPLLRQQEFAHVARKFERLRAQQREAERQAEHLFQTLLHRAFRGGVVGEKPQRFSEILGVC